MPQKKRLCAALGAVAGDADVQELARLANRHLPELKTHDRFGNRIDWVDFHPSRHELMTLAWAHEVPNLAWRTNRKNGHFARAVLSYIWNQVEHRVGCPTGMAYASHAGFEAEPALAIWAEKVKGTRYEFSRREVGDKPSVVVGYAMTEKQGGSDLRETQTIARFSHAADYHGKTAHWYELTGHKWFCSVPQSDGFFTLAKVKGEVTCFFLPRTLPDGSYNRFFVQRLKDKAGNKSNASSEVEYAGTLAIRVGEEGRGIREILSHAHLTRLDFAVGSAGLMRRCLTLALQHTSTRRAFGTSIADRRIGILARPSIISPGMGRFFQRGLILEITILFRDLLASSISVRSTSGVRSSAGQILGRSLLMLLRRTILKAFGASLVATPAAVLAQADKARVKVGVRGGVDEEIFEVVTKVAARGGLTVEPVVITGTVSPNEALNSGDIDANSFQHVPFLNSQVKARGYKILSVGNTYVSPIAIYSKRYKTLAELPSGARIGIPDDVSNQTRALLLLHQHKLITLREGADPYNSTITLADVASNPRNLKLIELASVVLARTLAELDAAVIVNTFAFQVGLLATRDGIAVEAKENNPYINIIAVRELDRNAPWVPKLVAAYQSQDVRDFIARRYEGSVFPSF